MKNIFSIQWSLKNGTNKWRDNDKAAAAIRGKRKKSNKMDKCMGDKKNKIIFKEKIDSKHSWKQTLLNIEHLCWLFRW